MIEIGQICKREIGGCPHYIVVLSSDREPGWETGEAIYRCAQFQASQSDGRLFGAQIVLYTEGELVTFDRTYSLGTFVDLIKDYDRI